MIPIQPQMSARAAYNQIEELKKLKKKKSKNKNKNSQNFEMESSELVKLKSKKHKIKPSQVGSTNGAAYKEPNEEFDESSNGNLHTKKRKMLVSANEENGTELNIEIPKKLKTSKKKSLKAKGSKSLETNDSGKEKKTKLSTSKKRKKASTNKKPKYFDHFAPFNDSGKESYKTWRNDGSKVAEDSQRIGGDTFKWMIEPIAPKEFFSKYWEQRPLLVKRENVAFYEDILSTMDIDKMLREHNLIFTKNIDLTSYKNGKRETLNPEGRALAPVVWDFYNEGCSIRLLNPQTFNHSVWRLLSSLTEYFNSFCGANVYLTPPGTQGFAPHWDDIEAFILQLEGKKRWRVYSPRVSEEVLPRTSSGNFGPEDQLGEPVIDCVLECGDLLYLPRGFIHQGLTLNEDHSLHITVSTYQKNSYVDFLEKLLPAALANAAAKDLSFRKGLPRKYLNHAGIVHSDGVSSSAKASEFVKHIHELVNKMMEYAPIDAAVDEMAKGFIHDSLPPYISKEERNCSAFGGGEKWCAKTKTVTNVTELEPDTDIRLLRRGCVRLVVEENSVRLYHSIENSLEYHAEEPKFIELEAEIAPGMEALINKYPKFLSIESLPLETLEAKMSLAMGLWEKGLITTFEPLTETYDE